MKVILILSLFIIFALEMHAQPFNGGLELGLNACQMDGDQMSGYHHPALLAGAYVDLQLKNNFFVELGLKYSGRGATQSLQSVAPGFLRTKVSLHYVELPLLAGKTVWTKYRIKVGLLPSYLFDTKAIDAYGNIADESLYDYYSFDIPATFGVEYRWSEKWLTNMQFSESVWFITDNPYLRNRYISISLKYYIASKTQ